MNAHQIPAHETMPKRSCVRFLKGLTLLGFSLLLMSGCGNPDRQLLTGVWQLDHTDRLEKRIADPDDFAPASKMTLEFRGGGRLITTTRMGEIDRVKRGSWDVVEYQEKEKRLLIRCTLADQTTEHEVELLDDHRIKLAPPNMAGVDLKLTFRRK